MDKYTNGEHKSAPPSLRQLLKQETSSDHGKLDQAVSRIGAFQSLRGYAAYLMCMRQLHQRYRASIAFVSAECGLDDPSTNIDGAIGQDLQALSVVERPNPQLPGISYDSTLANWGAGYVLEGSSLGSVHVRRNIQSKLPVEEATNYLSLMNQFAGSRWPIIIEHLSVIRGDATDPIAAAKEVFAFAQSLFCDRASSVVHSPTDSIQ